MRVCYIGNFSKKQGRNAFPKIISIIILLVDHFIDIDIYGIFCILTIKMAANLTAHNDELDEKAAYHDHKGEVED